MISDYILTHRWAYNVFGVFMMLVAPFIFIAEVIFDGIMAAWETAAKDWDYMVEQYRDLFWPSNKNWKANKR